MKGLTKILPGGRKLFEDVWLSFYPGAKIGIIGVNGSGKSTLMKIMAGLDQDIQGEAWAAERTTVGYLPQEPQLDPSLSVQENVLRGFAAVQEKISRFEALSARFAEPLTDEEMADLLLEQGTLQEEIDAVEGWEIERFAARAMEALRCPTDRPVSTLSGGEKRRVALCQLLVQKPDILLLDEPTNHLDAASVAWLERFLMDYKGTVILVTHDRYFLDNVVGWILELDRGQGYPFEGNYSHWLEAKAKRLEVEKNQETARQKALARELEWVRQSPRARQSKSRARLSAYEALLNEGGKATLENAQIIIPPGPRLGDVVIQADHLSKAFGPRRLLKDLSFRLPPGGIVGVIGANGTGKTTLLNLLTGKDTPDSGTLRLGETVQLGYVDQSRDALDPEKTVWQEISGGLDELTLGKRSVSSRAYCSSFNFRGADQQKRVGLLSGGERGRLHLAKVLKSGANVILLDEPTNDLDVETLRALEEGLLAFAGCAVVVSHDRWFLDRIATHILAFENDGNVVWFDGNYAAYEEDLRRRTGPTLTKTEKRRSF